MHIVVDRFALVIMAAAATGTWLAGVGIGSGGASTWEGWALCGLALTVNWGALAYYLRTYTPPDGSYSRRRGEFFWRRRPPCDGSFWRSHDG